MNILSLENISKKYTQGKAVVQILANVNLSVKQGDLIAVIGSSGSGKSTLLHMAGLLDNPDSGKVIIDELDYHFDKLCKTAHIIRLSKIGFIYQQHHLLKDFTAIENVIMPRLISGDDQSTAFKEAKLLLSELGLAKKLQNMPGELSGGEKQRVAIARSLINNPKIILADEPTGNLDPTTAEEVFNLFLKTAKEKNTAIVMVTHNHEMAQNMNKIYELKNGILAPH